MTRLCTKCDKLQKLAAFHIHNRINGKEYYRSKCRSCVALQRREYTKSKQGKEVRQAYAIKRRESILFKIHAACRSNIVYYLKQQKSNKNGQSMLHFLPYSIKELVEHLEKQFEPWMNWNNYGKASIKEKTWQIDHIIPTNSLPYDSMSHPNFLKCWSLENLRPLYSIENIVKYNKLPGDFI